MNIQDLIEHIFTSSGKRITFRFSTIGNDKFIIISGGEEHIGTVSFSTTKKNFTWVDPPHKEYHITDKILAVFTNSFPDSRIVVLSGIHFDEISKVEIAEIVDLSVRWAKKTVGILAKDNGND